MEILLALIILVFALCFFAKQITDFIKELKSNGSTKLGNGFEAKISFVPIGNKKSEASATNTNSTDDTYE